MCLRTNFESSSSRMPTWSIRPSTLPSRIRPIRRSSTSWISTFNCYNVCEPVWTLGLLPIHLLSQGKTALIACRAWLDLSGIASADCEEVRQYIAGWMGHPWSLTGCLEARTTFGGFQVHIHNKAIPRRIFSARWTSRRWYASTRSVIALIWGSLL